MIKADMNQVSLDGNSLISDKIRDECYNKFKDVPNFDIPEICGKMSHTNTYNNIQTTTTNNDSSNTGEKTTIKINTSNTPLNSPKTDYKSKSNLKPIPSKKSIENTDKSQKISEFENQLDTPPESPKIESSKSDNLNNVIGSFTNDVATAIAVEKEKNKDTTILNTAVAETSTNPDNTNDSTITSVIQNQDKSTTNQPNKNQQNQDQQIMRRNLLTRSSR
jgi:hypothetical protein